MVIFNYKPVLNSCSKVFKDLKPYIQFDTNRKYNTIQWDKRLMTLWYVK